MPRLVDALPPSLAACAGMESVESECESEAFPSSNWAAAKNRADPNILHGDGHDGVLPPLGSVAVNASPKMHFATGENTQEIGLEIQGDNIYLPEHSNTCGVDNRGNTGEASDKTENSKATTLPLSKVSASIRTSHKTVLSFLVVVIAAVMCTLIGVWCTCLEHTQALKCAVSSSRSQEACRDCGLFYSNVWRTSPVVHWLSFQAYRTLNYFSEVQIIMYLQLVGLGSWSPSRWKVHTCGCIAAVFGRSCLVLAQRWTYSNVNAAIGVGIFFVLVIGVPLIWIPFGQRCCNLATGMSNGRRVFPCVIAFILMSVLQEIVRFITASVIFLIIYIITMLTAVCTVIAAHFEKRNHCLGAVLASAIWAVFGYRLMHFRTMFLTALGDVGDDPVVQILSNEVCALFFLATSMTLTRKALTPHQQTIVIFKIRFLQHMVNGFIVAQTKAFGVGFFKAVLTSTLLVAFNGTQWRRVISRWLFFPLVEYVPRIRDKLAETLLIDQPAWKALWILELDLIAYSNDCVALISAILSVSTAIPVQWLAADWAGFQEAIPCARADTHTEKALMMLGFAFKLTLSLIVAAVSMRMKLAYVAKAQRSFRSFRELDEVQIGGQRSWQTNPITFCEIPDEDCSFPCRMTRTFNPSSFNDAPASEKESGAHSHDLPATEIPNGSEAAHDKQGVLSRREKLVGLSFSSDTSGVGKRQSLDSTGTSTASKHTPLAKYMGQAYEKNFYAQFERFIELSPSRPALLMSDGIYPNDLLLLMLQEYSGLYVLSVVHVCGTLLVALSRTLDLCCVAD